MRKKKSSADLPWYEKDLPWDEEELLWGLYDASMELKQLPLLGQIGPQGNRAALAKARTGGCWSR